MRVNGKVVANPATYLPTEQLKANLWQFSKRLLSTSYSVQFIDYFLIRFSLGAAIKNLRLVSVEEQQSR